MLYLSEEDKLKIVNADFVTQLNINGVSYYIKKDYDFTEIVGEALAKVVGLQCAHYIPLNINGINYVASVDLDSGNNFCLFFNYIKDNSLYNLYNIWTILEENFENVDVLMNDITLMYIYDILFMNSDRNFKNFGIIKNDIESLVILDNGYIFDEDLPPQISSIYGGDDQLDSGFDLEMYLSTSSSEFIKKFINIFDFLTPNKIKEIFDKVENENNIVLNKKSKWISLYNINYENIKGILKRYRGDYHAR